MRRDMPTGLYTSWEFDTDIQKFKATHNRSRNFENMVMSIYRERRPDCEIESFLHLENRKKINCFNVDSYCDHSRTVFEAMGFYYHFASCQGACPSLTDQDVEEGNRKRDTDNVHRKYIKEKGYNLKECGSVSGGKVSKLMPRSKITSGTTLPPKDFFLQTPFW